MAKGKQGDGEDDYSAKLDMCLTDGIVKTGNNTASNHRGFSYILFRFKVNYQRNRRISVSILYIWPYRLS